jgi:hypothetical protein
VTQLRKRMLEGLKVERRCGVSPFSSERDLALIAASAALSEWRVLRPKGTRTALAHQRNGDKPSG